MRPPTRTPFEKAPLEPVERAARAASVAERDTLGVLVMAWLLSVVDAPGTALVCYKTCFNMQHKHNSEGTTNQGIHLRTCISGAAGRCRNGGFSGQGTAQGQRSGYVTANGMVRM